MTTLIAAYNSGGCIGRCDAKCHNATHPVCECICGGRNHGVGHRQAAENTREMAADIIKTHADQKVTDIIVNHVVNQLELL